MGFIPGLEFRVALTMARQYGSRVILGDRDQQLTMGRMGESVLPDVSRAAVRIFTDTALRRKLEHMENNTTFGRAAEGLTGSPTKAQLEAIIESTKVFINLT
jgi:pheromone shutdown protein TraB